MNISRGLSYCLNCSFIFFDSPENSGDWYYEKFAVRPACRAGSGHVRSNNLELSNVDLAQQFVGMIMNQRGFQANARVVSVSDELLSELVNLKR
jgi:flagellar hook protein FlgE